MNFLEVVYILCTPRTGMLSSFETWIVSTVRHSGTKPWSFVLQILPYKTSWAGINEVKTKCCSHSLFNSPACIQVLTCGYFTKPVCYVQLCSCFSFFNIEVSFLIFFSLAVVQGIIECSEVQPFPNTGIYFVLKTTWK